MGDFNVHELANTAWAFAKACQPDTQLFMALATMAERSMSNFNMQNLANTAWAFLTAGMLAPALLDPILVLDAGAAEGGNTQAMHQCLSL